MERRTEDRTQLRNRLKLRIRSDCGLFPLHIPCHRFSKWGLTASSGKLQSCIIVVHSGYGEPAAVRRVWLRKIWERLQDVFRAAPCSSGSCRPPLREMPPRFSVVGSQSTVVSPQPAFRTTSMSGSLFWKSRRRSCGVTCIRSSCRRPARPQIIEWCVGLTSRVFSCSPKLGRISLPPEARQSEL